MIVQVRCNYVAARQALKVLFTEHVKRSTQGKLAAATQVQSAEYLKPLFRTLRSRVRGFLRCFFVG